MRARFQGTRGSAAVAQLRAAWPRYLATAVLVVLVALGLRSLLDPPRAAAPPAPAAQADAPSRDFALQFARAYLTYDARAPQLRNRALAPFLAEDMDADAGFYASHGSQRVLWVQVASDQPALLGGRTITVAAGLDTQPAPAYLALTVSHHADGVALLGYPALVGAPALGAAVPAPTRESVEDPAVSAVVQRGLRNYLGASAPNLAADLAPAAEVTLPTVSLTVRSVDRIEWLAGAGSGAVLATLTAADQRGGTYALAYELGIAYRERPYLDFIEVIPTSS